MLWNIKLQLGKTLDPPDIQTEDDEELGEEVEHRQPVELHPHRRLPADSPGAGGVLRKL